MNPPARALSGRDWVVVVTLALLVAGLLTWALQAGSPGSARGVDWIALQTREEQPDPSRPVLQILSGAAAQADVLLWGDSSAREAYLEDRAIEAALAARGAPLRVVSLASSAQQTVDSLYLLSMMPVRAGQIHVLHLRHLMLRRDPWERIRSGNWLVVPAEAPVDVLAPVLGSVHGAAMLRWRNARELLRRKWIEPLRLIVRSGVYGLPARAAPVHDPVSSVAVVDAARRTRDQDLIRKEMAARFDAHLVPFATALEAFVGRVERGGGRVVFAAPPATLGVLGAEDAARLAAFERTIAEVRSRHRVERIDLNEVAGPGESEIADPTHVNAAGRDRWSAAFIDWLVGSARRQGTVP